jgi:hypothetical protein
MTASYRLAKKGKTFSANYQQLAFISTEEDMYIADTRTWYLERLIRLLAGIFVLGSSLLGYFVSPIWFLFTGFIGAMLTIFALTGFCPMSIILYTLGARERCKC